MQTKRWFAAMLMLGALACNKQATPDGAEGQGEGAQKQEAGQPERAYVTSITGLRRAANEEKKVDDASGKKVVNWLATLYRGEEFTVSKVEGEWAFGKASDDTEGWLKKDTLLPTDGITVATVLEDTKTFGRPDLLALNAQRKIEPGSLLFVLKNKDQFCEVNLYGKQSAWVLSDKLNTESNEVAASKLLNKIRWLKERKDPSADAMMELARNQFSSTRVMGVLDPQAPPEAPAGGGGAAENEGGAAEEESGD